MEKIGKGGNGEVYLAQDMELGCKWAVKVIEKSQKKEAGVLKELSHPFLPKMIDYQEIEGYCFLVMEYIEGETLENYLLFRKKIEFQEAMDMILNIAHILSYFHGKNKPIIYGDLKPANLIRTNNGDIYLVDFGSVIQSFRKDGLVCYGTRGYAAPEQYEGRISCASDVYAFGKIMQDILKKVKFSIRKIQMYKIVFGCCRKQEHFRYRDMKFVSECLKKVKTETNGLGSLKKTLVMVMMGLCIVTMSVREKIQNSVFVEKDFKEEVTNILDILWENKIYLITGELQRDAYEEIEKGMKSLLKEFEKEVCTCGKYSLWY